MKITIINHSNGTHFVVEDIRYIDLSHNEKDKIEIGVNMEMNIPRVYREHTPSKYTIQSIKES